MIKTFLSAAVLLLSASGAAYAAESGAEVEGQTTTMKIQDAKPATETNKPGQGPDVDEIITNKKMRAESGSKSKWSIGMALSYAGGTIETPLNEKRPDLTGGQGQTLNASAGGSVGAGYKLTTTDRLGLDVGVRWISPFQYDAPKGYIGTRRDVSNPSLTYSKIYKLGGIQSIFSFGPTVYTYTNLRERGYQYQLSLGQVMAYEFGHSGFSLGLAVGANYNTFDKDDVESKANSSDYDYSASPTMEYVINDTLNLRTVFNWAIYEHDRDASTGTTIFKNENQQSVGLGISVTRDIFLYPNIQFQPLDLTHVFRSDKTNVALNANINVF